MQPYERITCVVERRRPDRPAIDYIATPEAHRNLKQHTGIEDDEQLLQALGADIRRVAPRYVGPAHFCGESGIGGGGTDMWGIRWDPVEYALGTYNEIAVHPLAEAKTVQDVENYAWPKLDWLDFSHLKEDIKRINDKERYAILFFAGGAFETPWYMRGLTRFLMDLVECPDVAEAISRRAMEFNREKTLRAIEACGGLIDMVGSGGDIGTQRGMMISPELWRAHIKPYSRGLIRTFKDMGLMTYYHSCGSIRPVIEDFIEMGLDILDPIQPRAKDMDAESLSAAYGTRLSFHGGIDEQHLLPFGSVDDVRREVTRLADVLGRDGGYIVAPAHAIQSDTPAENMLAIYQTAQAHRW